LSEDNEFAASRIVQYCDENNVIVSNSVAKEDHINNGNKLGIIDEAKRKIKTY
jgi:hypothetical protein